ncbi:GNAT family N-acetyltransferase [Ruminococcus sp.]
MNAEIDISNVVLKTERLTLRPWLENDLNDFFEYAKVEGVGEMAGWSHHKTLDETRNILELFINGRKTFAIELGGKVIGSLGIEEYDESKLPELNDRSGREIGFVLSKEYWGKGYMTEAVKAVIAYLFDEVGLDFISCGYFIDNARSKRVQEKCGFKFYKSGKYQTAYGVTKDECINILFK